MQIINFVMVPRFGSNLESIEKRIFYLKQKNKLLRLILTRCRYLVGLLIGFHLIITVVQSYVHSILLHLQEQPVVVNSTDAELLFKYIIIVDLIETVTLISYEHY